MTFFDEITKRAEKDLPYTIAFYGASTVSFEYVFPNWGEIIRYVLKDKVEEAIGDWRRAYWNVQTMNLGLDGASSQDLADRLDYLVLSKKPDLIFLLIGKNDAYKCIDKRLTEENTKKIIGRCLEQNIRVVFATSFPPLRIDLGEKVAPYVELDRKIAHDFRNESNFIFVDFYDSTDPEVIEKSYTLVCTEGNDLVGIEKGEIDPLHFNRFGNMIVAKIFLKKAFSLEFDEEKFMLDLADETKKYPEY